LDESVNIWIENKYSQLKSGKLTLLPKHTADENEAGCVNNRKSVDNSKCNEC